MIAKSIAIRRQNYYGYGKVKETDPFLAQVEVESPFGEVKLNIDAERTKQLVGVIADLIAEAGQQTAAALTAEVINGSANLLPAE